MKLLVNLSTLKLGGGQNVALNFLHALNDLSFEDVEFYFFVAENSEAHKFLERKGINNFTTTPNNAVKRIL